MKGDGEGRDGGAIDVSGGMKGEDGISHKLEESVERSVYLLI